MWKYIKQWNARRRAVKELSALDDKTLRDIGLSRGEIFWAVHED